MPKPVGDTSSLPKARPVQMQGYPPPNPPMTDSDYVAINNALRQLDDLIGNLQKHLEGGAPCDDQLSGCRDLYQRYEAWKKANFPGRP